MKKFKYVSLVLLVALSVSCTKNEIEYGTKPIGNMAEFQLHYFVPVTAVSTNNITKVEINSKLYANTKAPLATYNVIPGGTVGKFYTVNPGSVNVKMYQGTASDVLVYDQNVTLVQGKQNLFVHDFLQAPVVFNNGYPYVANTTENSDSTCWIKFYNFLYETPGTPNVPTTLRLQYQYIDSKTTLPVNIGPPVAFGETTGWQAVPVRKTTFNSAGSQVVTMKIRVVDAAGIDLGPLSVKVGAAFSAYTATQTLGIGRRYHHTMSGMRADAPNSAVRVFTAL